VTSSHSRATSWRVVFCCLGDNVGLACLGNLGAVFGAPLRSCSTFAEVVDIDSNYGCSGRTVSRLNVS